jgi:hypothetical protein
MRRRAGREVAVAEAPIAAHEDRRVDGRRTDRQPHRRRGPEIDELPRLAGGDQLRGGRLVHQRRMHVAGLDGVHDAALPATDHPHLRDAEAGPREQPGEPGLLGSAGAREADARAREVLDRPYDARVRVGHHEDHRWCGRETEHDPRRLRGQPRAEAKDGLERRGHQVGLPLGERLGGARLGAGRLEGDGQALPREVALRGGDAQGKILG